jgi:hypothetical protein
MNNKNIKADIVVGLGYGDEGEYYRFFVSNQKTQLLLDILVVSKLVIQLCIMA